jgi:lipopolysaccharide export system protein LptA
VIGAGGWIVLAAVLLTGTEAWAQAPKAPARPAPGRTAPAGDAKGQPVTIDADHMESFRKESLVIFTGSVVARQAGSVQHADRMEVYLDERGDRVLRTISTGNIRIVTRDCRVGTAKRSEYYDGEQRVELIGNARVWEGDNVVSGEKITIFLNQERSVVQAGKQERVKAVFYPKDDTQAPAREATAAGCKN